MLSGDAELLRDLRRALALREQVRDEARGRAELRERWCVGQRRVLRGRGVQQRRQLVHLQERALRLRDAHAHVRLEGEAEVRVDRIEAVAAEERQQMVREPPAVVTYRVRRDLLVAERAVDLRLEPPRGVDVEGQDCAVLVGGQERGRRLRWCPHANAHPRKDVPQLRAGARLVPSPAAATCAARTLVEDHPLASGADAKAEVEGAGAVRERADEDGPGRQRSHYVSRASATPASASSRSWPPAWRRRRPSCLPASLSPRFRTHRSWDRSVRCRNTGSHDRR